MIYDYRIKKGGSGSSGSSGFSGNYNDLTNKPTTFSGDYGDLTNKPAVFSGNYGDLTNKPAVFSGNYSDLNNKPDTSPLLVWGNAIRGDREETFTVDLTNRKYFLIHVKFYDTYASSIMPIKTTSNFAIMCPMSVWFDNSPGRVEVGTFLIGYNVDSKLFKVIKAFYRHSTDWTDTKIRNNNGSYVIETVHAI